MARESLQTNSKVSSPDDDDDDVSCYVQHQYKFYMRDFGTKFTWKNRLSCGRSEDRANFAHLDDSQTSDRRTSCNKNAHYHTSHNTVYQKVPQHGSRAVEANLLVGVKAKKKKKKKTSLSRIMGKKPRSQRRKKGSAALGEQDDADDGGEMEALPEDHTVADSITTFGGDEFGTIICFFDFFFFSLVEECCS
jgi:hypothetical protein